MSILFLLSHQRSGSHFLKQTLNCHNDYLKERGWRGREYFALPEVLTPGIDRRHPGVSHWLFGPFLRTRVQESPDEWANPEGIAKAARLYLDYLEQTSNGYIAFADIKLNQLYIGEGWYHAVGTTPRLLYDIVRKGKIVFLRRKNLVRAVLSGQMAEKTGIWHVRDASATSNKTQLNINCDTFLNLLRQLDESLRAADEWLSRWQRSVLKIDYEDLYDENTLTCNREAFDRIAEFSGLAVGANWHSPLHKIGTYSLPEVIANYAEFRRKIGQTKYASMLEESSAERADLKRSA